MYIGIDIGGTQLRISASKSLTDLSSVIEDKIAMQDKYEDDITSIISHIKDLCKGESPQAIGISVAGALNSTKTSLINSPNLHSWNNKPLYDTILHTFNIPVYIENDAVCAAYAEGVYGQGQEKDFLFLTWSTGFGGARGVHRDQKLYILPSEPGHQIIYPQGRLCGCGQLGCAEAYVGGKHIQEIFHKEPQNLSTEEWNSVLNDLTHATHNIIAINPSPLIIFAGGIAIHQQDKISILEEKIEKTLKIFPMPEICVTTFGDNLGIYGTYALLKQHIV